MGDRVEEILEKMIPELEEFVFRNLFSRVCFFF